VLEGILLGLLRDPRSGYDVAAEFRRGARHLWAADLSQIYRTLARLEEEGHVTSRVEPSPRGPERRVYRRTTAGRDALLGWLAEAPELPPERFGYLAQLFFMGEAGDRGRTLSFLKELRRRLAERLQRLEEIEPRIDTKDDDGFHGHLTLRLGILAGRARLSWCEESIRRVRQRAARRKR
jgi:DNA-binding PadR family transcriptional regulator